MQDLTEGAMIPELRRVLKRLHYPLEVMLVCVRWYAAYPLSFRHLEEMMQERGVFVDHSTVHRWALKILPIMALIFRRHKRPVGTSWRMDETYIKVAGQWKYLYRAVDKSGDAVDFLLTARRDLAAARRYLECAINLHGLPEKITIDKSGALNVIATEPLNKPWVLDVNATIKPLYGRQEGAELGDGPDSRRPALVRGDSGYGNEGILLELERPKQLASKQVSTSFFKKVSKNGAVALTCLVTVASN